MVSHGIVVITSGANPVMVIPISFANYSCYDEYEDTDISYYSSHLKARGANCDHSSRMGAPSSPSLAISITATASSSWVPLSG